MKAKEFAKTLLDIENESDPLTKIKLLDYLCDSIGYMRFAKYGDGTVVSKLEDVDIEDNMVKLIQKAERSLEDGDMLYQDISFTYLWALMDDDKKIQQLNRTDNNSAKVQIVYTLNSDDKKIEWIRREISKNPVMEYYEPEIICSLKSDVKKQEYLSENLDGKGSYKRLKIIASFYSDDIKKKYLEEFSSNRGNQIELVRSFEFDDNKMKWMSENKLFQFEIIASLKDDKNKLRYIEYANPEIKNRIIAVLQSDELKIKLMGNVPNIMIIESLESDDTKANFLDSQELSDEDKTSIILGFKSDNKKLRLLKHIRGVKEKTEVLKSLKNVDTEVLVQAVYEMGIDVAQICQKSNQLVFEKNLENSNLGLPSNLTFGIEIEAQGPWACIIRQFQNLCNNWNVKREPSIPEGVEVTSPVMSNNPKDIEGIYAINYVLGKTNFYVDENCGGHIHIGANILTTPQAYKRLIEIWCNTEKIMYKICNKPGAKPREGAISENAKIYSEYAFNNGLVWKLKNASIQKARDVLCDEQKDRALGLNFMNLKNDKNTVEFRIPNGTLDAKTWMENIKLFGRLMCIAEELGQIDNKKERTAEDDRKAFLTNEIKDDSKTDGEKLNDLLNLLFKEEKDRKVYEKRYLANFSFDEPVLNSCFKKIDFGESYEGLRYSKNNNVER